MYAYMHVSVCVCMYMCSGYLSLALSGKAAAETRVCEMMNDLEDKQETIEHLQV